MKIILDEAAWVSALPLQSRLCFLARLSFELTIAGRSSYEAGTDELAQPRQLRRINEIAHRVSACLCQLLDGTCPDGLLASLPDWVFAYHDGELDGLLQHSWSEAKRRLSPGAGH